MTSVFVEENGETSVAAAVEETPEKKVRWVQGARSIDGCMGALQ